MTWTVYWDLDRDDHRAIVNLDELATLPMENLRRLVKICRQYRDLNEEGLQLLPGKLEALQDELARRLATAQAAQDRLFRPVSRYEIRSRKQSALDQLAFNKALAKNCKTAQYRKDQADKKIKFIREELSL